MPVWKRRLGLAAAFENHHLTRKGDMWSLHSWLGMLLVLLFLINVRQAATQSYRMAVSHPGVPWPLRRLSLALLDRLALLTTPASLPLLAVPDRAAGLLPPARLRAASGTPAAQAHLPGHRDLPARHLHGTRRVQPPT